MKGKKISIVYLHANNYDVGGSDYCLFKLVSELDRAKFSPTVVLAKETHVADLYKKEGIPVTFLDMKRIKRTSNPFFFVKYIFLIPPTVFKILRIAKEHKCSIIHSNDFQDIYGGIAARLAGIAGVQHIRMIIVPSSFLTSLLKRLLTSFICLINDRIISVSDAVAKQMFSRNGIIDSKVITCHDWLDMEKVGAVCKESNIKDEFSIPKETPLVGTVGRLEHWKGQHILIEAIPKVLKEVPYTHFVIVGSKVKGRGRERYLEDLKKRSKRLGIEDKLTFIGGRKDIADVLSSLDIFVHTSVSPDPLPGVVMEAMYCSKPVIGPNEGGVIEEIEEGKTGLLYPAGNYSKMAEKIIFLLKRPSLAKEMGRAGKKKAENIFSKKKLYVKMENIYRQLVEDSDDHQS